MRPARKLSHERRAKKTTNKKTDTARGMNEPKIPFSIVLWQRQLSFRNIEFLIFFCRCCLILVSPAFPAFSESRGIPGRESMDPRSISSAIPHISSSLFFSASPSSPSPSPVPPLSRLLDRTTINDSLSSALSLSPPLQYFALVPRFTF